MGIATGPSACRGSGRERCAGAYSGDSSSPCGHHGLAAAVLKVEVVDHIRSMLWTTVPAFSSAQRVYATWIERLRRDDFESSMNSRRHFQDFKRPPCAGPPPGVLVLAYWALPPFRVWIAIALPALAMMQGLTSHHREVHGCGPKISYLRWRAWTSSEQRRLAFCQVRCWWSYSSYIFAASLSYTGTIRKMLLLPEGGASSAIKGRFSCRVRHGHSHGLGTGNSYRAKSSRAPCTGPCRRDGHLRRVLSRTPGSGPVVPSFPVRAGSSMSHRFECPSSRRAGPPVLLAPRLVLRLHRHAIWRLPKRSRLIIRPGSRLPGRCPSPTFRNTDLK